MKLQTLTAIKHYKVNNTLRIANIDKEDNFFIYSIIHTCMLPHKNKL